MSAVQPWRPRSAESALRGRQGCRGYGDSHGYGYWMGMGTVLNPQGPVGILWGFLIGWRLSGNALNMR